MSGPQEAADALRAMTDSINAAAEDHGVDGDRRDAWANGYAAGLAARAAAPPVEPPCAVCGDPKAKHDTDSTIAPHDYVPPSPDPVAGLRDCGFDCMCQCHALLAEPVPDAAHVWVGNRGVADGGNIPEGLRVFGLSVTEIADAIAIADTYRPSWRDARLTDPKGATDA